MTGSGVAVLVTGLAAGGVWYAGYPSAAWVAVTAAALLGPAAAWRLLPRRAGATWLDVPARVVRGDDVAARVALRPFRGTVRLAGRVLGEPVDRSVRGGSAFLTVTAATRGVLRSELDRVLAIGPWGLTCRPLCRPAPAETLVLPRRLALAAPRPAAFPADDGPAGTRRGGSEFGGLREYADADDPRQISWAASARTADGALMVRQNVLSRPAGYHVVLDSAADDPAAFETAVELAYSVAWAVHHTPGHRLIVTITVDGVPRHATGLAEAERLLAAVQPTARPDALRVPRPRGPQTMTRLLITAARGSLPIDRRTGRLVVFRLGPAAPMRRSHETTTFTVPDLAAAARAWSWLVRA